MATHFCPKIWKIAFSLWFSGEKRQMNITTSAAQWRASIHQWDTSVPSYNIILDNHPKENRILLILKVGEADKGFSKRGCWDAFLKNLLLSLT